MKKAILCIFAICVVANLFAQSQPKTMRDRIAAIQANRSASKTTVPNASRCIAMAYSPYNGSSYVVTDSQTFTYSGGRGGSLMSEMKEDNSKEYYIMSGAIPAGSTTQTFDSHNNILVHTEQDIDLSGAYTNFYRATYTYDAFNNPVTETTEYWVSGAWENQAKYIRTFTAANKVATETEKRWYGGSWNTEYYTEYTYNSLLSPVIKLKKLWNTSTSAFELSSKDTMVYSPSNDLSYDILYDYVTSVNTWTPLEKTSYSSYLAPGLYRILVSQQWDFGTSSFINRYKDSISYNSDDLAVYLTQMSPGTGNTWVIGSSDGQTHYYYELYESGIDEIGNIAAEAGIYPNPSSSQLNIAAPYLITSVSISNMLGQVLSSYKFNSEKVQVNVNDLPPGAYVVRINGTEARNFLKQ